MHYLFICVCSSLCKLADVSFWAHVNLRHWDCVQLLHTILHITDLIIFPLALQTITIAPMMSIWGKGERMAKPIDLPFGLWSVVGWRKHKFSRICQVAPMCPQYHWTIHVWRWCDLLSNYFDHLFSFLILGVFGISCAQEGAHLPQSETVT